MTSILMFPIECTMETRFLAFHSILTEALRRLLPRVSTLLWIVCRQFISLDTCKLTLRFLFFFFLLQKVEGIIDHADSAGNGGRYGIGDLQWMTAGEGIVHSEMFPLLKTDAENPTRFFQIWLNLPAKSKMAKPSFAMFWANDVPKYISEDQKAKATVWVGCNYLGVTKNNSPPPESWASDPSNDVALVHITLKPGGKMTVPKAQDETVNRSLYYIEGKNGVLVDGTPIKQKVSLIMDPNEEVVLELPEDHTEAGEFLWMQGKPIEEPVAQYGPFVMNTQQEIRQAFADYSETQFGGWPWPRDDMVFPAEKGRFALFDGKESTPSDDDTCEK